MEEQTIVFRRNNAASDSARELYKETLENSSTSCDFIIKTGAQRIEHKCHRIILASASELLWNVLASAEPGKLPVLLLPDLTSEAMKYVLSYVYNGEVKVPYMIYSDFVDACKLLEIKASLELMDVQTNDEIAENEEKDTNHEEPMIINDENDDDKSASDIEDVSFDEDSIESMPEISNNLTDDERIRRFRSSIIVHEEELSLYERAKKSFRVVYERINKKPKKPLDEVVNTSRLIYKNKDLVRATHICGFCGKPISSLFKKTTLYFDTTYFKQHLTKMHNLKYTPLMIKKSKQKLMKLTKVTKIHQETEFQKHIRTIYDHLDKKPDVDLESVVNKSELVMEGDYLKRGQHSCGFCGKIFTSYYKEYKNSGKLLWNDSTLKNHLKRDHKLKYIK